MYEYDVNDYRLLNFVSQKFCYVLLSYLRSTAQKLATDRNSEFAKRIAANRGDVYGEIKRRLQMFHPSSTTGTGSGTGTAAATTATATTSSTSTSSSSAAIAGL